MPGVIYNAALLGPFSGAFDYKRDEFSVLLASSKFFPDASAQSSRADVVGEVEGQGYSLGGARVEVDATQIDDNTIEIYLGSADWRNSKIKAGYAVYYRNRGGNPADDELIAAIEFSSEQTSVNGRFALTASAIRLHKN